MSIKVLFFGNTADIVGERALRFEAETTEELLVRLASEHPRLASSKLLIAVNQEYVSENANLSDGDEVAIFSPVSGG